MIILYICFMGKISGIQVKKDARGHATQVIISVRKHPDLVEDLLDIIEAEKHRHEPTTPLKEVLAKLDKKHGIKRDL